MPISRRTSTNASAGRLLRAAWRAFAARRSDGSYCDRRNTRQSGMGFALSGAERLLVCTRIESLDLAAYGVLVCGARGVIEVTLGTRLVVEVAVAVYAPHERRRIPHFQLLDV